MQYVLFLEYIRNLHNTIRNKNTKKKWAIDMSYFTKEYIKCLIKYEEFNLISNCGNIKIIMICHTNPSK